VRLDHLLSKEQLALSVPCGCWWRPFDGCASVCLAAVVLSSGTSASWSGSVDLSSVLLVLPFLGGWEWNLGGGTGLGLARCWVLRDRAEVGSVSLVGPSGPGAWMRAAGGVGSVVV
jgi:hypothetical protein